MRVYYYKIDLEGRLWHEACEITDASVLQFFMEQLEKVSDKWRVVCQGETNWIEADDVPFVIQDLHIEDDKIWLIFPGNYREILDASTLEVGRDNILYCRIRLNKFKARFNRKSYLTIAKFIESSDAQAYFINFAGKTHFVKLNSVQ